MKENHVPGRLAQLRNVEYLLTALTLYNLGYWWYVKAQVHKPTQETFERMLL